MGLVQHCVPDPFRVSGFLWHSSRWAHQSLLKIFQYTSGLEVLACSFDINFNHYSFIPTKCFFIAIIIFSHIVFLHSQRSKNKQSRGSLTEPNHRIFQWFRPWTCWGILSTLQTNSCIQLAFRVLQRPSTFFRIFEKD